MTGFRERWRELFGRQQPAPPPRPAGAQDDPPDPVHTLRVLAAFLDELHERADVRAPDDVWLRAAALRSVLVRLRAELERRADA